MHTHSFSGQRGVPDLDCSGVFNLCTDGDKERLGRAAVQAIHEQMDDDKDGMIESSESTDVSLWSSRSIISSLSIGFQFIKEELESMTDAVRHKHFQSINVQITFDDLWTQWQSNPGRPAEDSSENTLPS